MVPDDSDEDSDETDTVHSFHVDMYELCRTLHDHGINYCDLVGALLDGSDNDSYDKIYDIYHYLECQTEHKKTMKKVIEAIPFVSSVFFYRF